MRTTPLALLTAFVFALGLPLLLTGCTPSTGGGVTSDGYIAPATVSPIEATERMRSQYRDFR